jgi:chromosome segregation ATPase
LSDQLTRIEDMMVTLIKMQATNNAKIEELTDEMKEVKVDLQEVKADLKETKDTLHTFRSETNMYLKKLDRHMKLIEEDLDRTMVSVESKQPPNN